MVKMYSAISIIVFIGTWLLVAKFARNRGGALNTVVVRHGGGFVAGLLAVGLFGAALVGIVGPKGSEASTQASPAAVQPDLVLPPSLSCSEDHYPSEWKQGRLFFTFSGPGAVMLGDTGSILSVDQQRTEGADRIIHTIGGVKQTGEMFPANFVFRLHPASSDGANRFKIDITTNDNAAKQWSCLGQ
jgi:hypothetical protein